MQLKMPALPRQTWVMGTIASFTVGLSAPAGLITAYACPQLQTPLGLVQEICPQSGVSSPPPTKSRYMKTYNTGTLYSEGEALGRGAAAQPQLVILDFGHQEQNPTWGALLLDNSTFATNSHVEQAVENYLNGYLQNRPTGSTLEMVVGTNSSGSASRTAGQSWASLVNDIWNYWVNYWNVTGITVAGGLDAETDSGWASSGQARAWTDGYSNSTGYPTYDYGDAGGCPSVDSTSDASCNTTWKKSDVGYVSATAPGVVHVDVHPAPESYFYYGATARIVQNADQWQAVDFYEQANSASMLITAVLTQHQACADQSWPKTCYSNGDGTGYQTNTPDQGWQQMYGSLGGDPSTQEAATQIPYLTDISWQN